MIHIFKIINNIDEYKEFINSVQNEFECIESWQDFFGFELKWNEETGELLEIIQEYQGEIKNKPDKFPCILYSNIIWVGSNRLSASKDLHIIDFIDLEGI